jgi:flagellar biosynthesis anti-sigma factor FlgM
MRIDSNKPIPSDLTTDRAQNSAKSDKTSGTSSPAQDGFSVDTTNLGALQAQAMATPEIRHDRVQALRESIRNGSYEIDPAKIADAMLRDAS